jgi:hypothetical protein
MTEPVTLRVIHGNPTPEELAAATAVLLARRAARSPAHPARLPRRRSSWRMVVSYQPPTAWVSA